MRKFLIIGLLLLMASPVLAGRVTIQEAKIVPWKEGFSYLQVQLEGLFFPELKKALMEGIPININCSVIIEKDRAILWDPVLWKGIYSRLMKYNLLTKTFAIQDPPEEEKRFSSFEAFSKEAQTLRFPLPTSPLKEKGTYVEIQVYRRTASLFFPFNLIYSLISPAPTDFETNRVRLEVHQ